MINTTTATMSELRAFTTANDITIDGDKRLKASYQSAINDYQAIEAFEVDAALYAVNDAVASYNAEYLATVTATVTVVATDDTTITIYDPWDDEDDAIESTTDDSDRTILTAALPLILMLAVALKLTLWLLDNSLVVIRHIVYIVNHTVVGRAAKGWLTRVRVDVSQFANGLVYGI
jgi:hypothetical protein